MKLLEITRIDNRSKKEYAAVAKYLIEDVLAENWDRDRNMGFTSALEDAFKPLNNVTVRIEPYALCHEKMWRVVLKCVLPVNKPRFILETQAGIEEVLNKEMPWGLMEDFVKGVFRSCVKGEEDKIRKEYLQHLRNRIEEYAYSLARDEVRYADRMKKIRQDVKNEVPKLRQSAIARFKTETGLSDKDADEAMLLDPVLRPMLMVSPV